ncbi:phage BR0599 family protein [Ectopseudomonas oleovorans]|uniref:Bacteriophage phiJL001 Gp84 C-terminal domain-containing protein n=1 Tax=Ectopseudomonas oleovorans (strain CECT 5344) TaxID=1182590 RepID=W6QZY0_ECTO5|nr:phage BR0599 family protein [Pseudomonas oleovorans]CDM42380.1 hypothetical protein BN5_3838 [Pseudomonas oleovorans CECT 5344]CDR93003.1 hypothetical protein PPSAL_3779 [Pseudomonas oleovorans]
MSSASRELSLADGQPIRLYQFSRGVLRWSYTSADRNITYNNQVFRSVRGGIGDPGIIQSGDPQADRLVITAPADLEVALLYKGAPPSDEIGLTVFDLHYGEADAWVSWAGSIATVNWPALDRCRITCLSIEASMDAPGLTDVYSRTCTAVLGDTECKVDLNQYRVTTNLQSMTGASVFSGTFAEYPDGWFSGGHIEWPIGSGEYDRRHIERHIGSELLLLGGTAGVPPGGSVRTYPGCDGLDTTCAGKFSNIDNMRAQPHLQGSSPFDGNQVW